MVKQMRKRLSRDRHSERCHAREVGCAQIARVTLDSDLDVEMAIGAFKVILGAVTIVGGGSGVGTTISGVYDILTTMVTAHGIYADCLYAHIYNQGA